MEENRIVIEFENSDSPEEAAATRKQDEQFDRNSAWLQEHISWRLATIAGERSFVSPGRNSSWATRHGKRSLRQPLPTRRIAAGSRSIFPRKRWHGSMLCQGEWSLCDDGIVRPIMQARILGGDGMWRRIKFLLDTGADRTVIMCQYAGGVESSTRSAEGPNRWSWRPCRFR